MKKIYDISEKFPELDGAYFFKYYIPANTGSQDDFSRLLLKFKDGDSNAIDSMTKYIESLSLKTNFQRKHIGMRVLGSNELKANRPNGTIPLDTILRLMPINLLGWGYLRKNRTTQPLKNAGGKDSRMALLKNVYTYRSKKKFSSILIIDDVITTGTTINEITRAIKKTDPNIKIHFLAIAKTRSRQSTTEYPKISLDRGYLWK